ncbi:MAG: hypothetical protein HY917_00930 [Candidatus Diapherotrites archaeon]|nr:hypothetical protein [Candidatus Diapherotrites archaeon]
MRLNGHQLMTVWIVWLLLGSGFAQSADFSSPASDPVISSVAPDSSESNSSRILLADELVPLEETGLPPADPGTVPENGVPPNAGISGSPVPAFNSAQYGFTQPSQHMCLANNLSDTDAANIQNLLRSGFAGNNYVGLGPDGKPILPKQPAAGGDASQKKNPKLSLIEADGKGAAVKVDVPADPFEPALMSQWLNNYVDGSFSYGLVLNDSLRVGRCKAGIEDKDCALNQGGLTYRNSGAGIVADFKNVGLDVLKAGEASGATEWLKEKKDATLNFFGADVDLKSRDLDLVRVMAQSGDINRLTYQTLKRKESRLIPNSIKTDDFSAFMSTNCGSSADCYINTYSLFDKYFNSWGSFEMTSSTFAPGLYNEAKRLFGFAGRKLHFLRGFRDNLLRRLRAKFYSYDTFLGQQLAYRLERNITTGIPGLRQWWATDVGANHDLLKTWAWQRTWGKATAPGGFIHNLQVNGSVEEKAKMLRVTKDLLTHVKANHSKVELAQNAYEKVLNQFGRGSLQEETAMVQYGREMARWMGNIDDVGINIDAPEWAVKDVFTGFYDKGVRQLNTKEVVELNEDPRHIRRILDEFVDNGDWRNFRPGGKALGNFQSEYEADEAGNMILYQFDAENAAPGSHLGVHDIPHSIPRRSKNYWIQDDYGKYLKYTQHNIPFILGRTGPKTEVFDGAWGNQQVMRPVDFARRLVNGRIRSNLRLMANWNIEDTMLDYLRANGFVSRRYWSALDKLFAQEQELVRSYFTVKGGAAITAYPFAYWWLKRGGGQEQLSFLQLPDTWTTVKFGLGDDKIFNDAYLDFFANEGSDQGDMFAQVLNYLPWKQALDKVSETFLPAGNQLQTLTNNELRSETEDLAIYVNSPDDCAGCSVNFKAEGTQGNFESFSPYFSSASAHQAYILEYPRTAKARQIGQTLIAFAHHLNLSGDTKDIEPAEGDTPGEPIKMNGDVNKSCTEAVKRMYNKLGQGLTLNFSKSWGDHLDKIGLGGSRSGAILSGLQSLSFVMFGWPGVSATILTQTLLAPELQDCVDTEGGYYVHYFAAAAEEKPKGKESESAFSTEKVLNSVDQWSSKVLDGFKSSNETVSNEVLGKMKGEIEDFVNAGKTQGVVQASVKFGGGAVSSGQMDSRKLFYLWFKGRSTPSSYKTSGGKAVMDKATGKPLVQDNANGTLSYDGKTLVSNPDAVRLMAPNTAGPFEEIPRYLNEACITPSDEPALSIDAQGNATLINPQLIDCMRQAVENQTGLPLQNPQQLFGAFGAVKAVTTSTHPMVKVVAGQIVAEGYPRYEGGASAVLVMTDAKEIQLREGTRNVSLGAVQSIQFENGVILLKPNGCLLVYLMHHQDGILPKQAVKGLKANLTSDKNPQTGCEEPAIDLSVIANLDSDFQKGKAESFNQSLKHMGPFKVFETPAKRYVFFADKEQGCKTFLRVIDKETGKFTDYPINDLRQTPTGVEFTDDNGQKHTLDFSAENGVPAVKFDNNPAEVLTAAQGNNGSMWFDPEKGLWYAENGQLLPLLEAFRKGIQTKVEGDTVNSSAAGNTLNLSLDSGKGGLLDLPSVPEGILGMALYLGTLVAAVFFIRRVRKKTGK